MNPSGNNLVGGDDYKWSELLLIISVQIWAEKLKPNNTDFDVTMWLSNQSSLNIFHSSTLYQA